MHAIAVVFLTGITFTLAASSYKFHLDSPNYEYGYRVFDAGKRLDFGHSESRRMERTAGMYYVLLPDGRKQTVTYHANKNGYFPVIKFSKPNFKESLNDDLRSRAFQGTGFDDNDELAPKRIESKLSANGEKKYNSSPWRRILTDQKNSMPFRRNFNQKTLPPSKQKTNIFSKPFKNKFSTPNFRSDLNKNVSPRIFNEINSKNRKPADRFKSTQKLNNIIPQKQQIHSYHSQNYKPNHYDFNPPLKVNILSTIKPNVYKSSKMPERINNFYIQPSKIPREPPSSYSNFNSNINTNKINNYTPDRISSSAGYFIPHSGLEEPNLKFESLKFFPGADKNYDKSTTYKNSDDSVIPYRNPDDSTVPYRNPDDSAVLYRNPDDSVVPSVVPVIYPVEGDLLVPSGNPVPYNDDYGDLSHNTLGDYWDEDYL